MHTSPTQIGICAAHLHYDSNDTDAPFLAVMFLAAAVAVLAPFAAASKHKVEVQLQTARIPERDQRLEFPLEGDDSAFKFNFAEDGVRQRFQ